MSALELISLINQVLFVGLFVAVLWHALWHPSRAAWDTVLLFGSIAAVVLITRIATLLGVASQPWLIGVVLLLLNVAPFAMIRLVDDFSRTPRWAVPAGAIAFAIVGALGFVAFTSAPEAYELVTIAWFTIVGGYAALAFSRAALAAQGITRRRLGAVAIGAVLFIGAIVIVFMSALFPGIDLGMPVQLVLLVAVIGFFVGFAPPAWVRRAWREPDLRRFLESSMHLAAVPDEQRVVMELQTSAATAFGANGAAIGIADAHRPVMRYLDRSGAWAEYPVDSFIGGRAFAKQRRIVATDAGADDPDNANVYSRNAANTVIAAPITIEDRRIGVLTVYAERAPIFVEDDLWLLELLADQVAVLLEARAHAADEADLRAREDSARLKEEFLSAAAHDLRTPLTVVLGQAELLERRLERDPTAPIDPAGISRLAREARRLRDLVGELLDAQRLELGGVAVESVPTDLRDVVEGVQARLHERGIDLKTKLPAEPVTVSVDPARLGQVLDNLVENALKYTSSGELPELGLEPVDGEARLSVTDRGIGIPEGERERIFDRFYRGSNVQSVTDTGIGLGLYICRRIVEAHGGRIWVEQTPAGGSRFIVALALPQYRPLPSRLTPRSLIRRSRRRRSARSIRRSAWRGPRMPDLRVLVVDDEPDIRATVSAMLEIEGYDVAEAANGADALREIDERPPDVILLDMRMPVLDGWGFAAELRRRGHRTPIVVMTAARDAAHWASEIAASTFVAKPFGFDDLARAMEHVRQSH